MHTTSMEYIYYTVMMIDSEGVVGKEFDKKRFKKTLKMENMLAHPPVRHRQLAPNPENGGGNLNMLRVSQNTRKNLKRESNFNYNHECQWKEKDFL